MCGVGGDEGHNKKYRNNCKKLSDLVGKWGGVRLKAAKLGRIPKYSNKTIKLKQITQNEAIINANFLGATTPT